MMKILTLKQTIIIAIATAFFVVSLPVLAKSDKAGKVVFVLGKVTVVDKDNKLRKIRKGSSIFSGDTIKTNNKGMAQVRMVDNAFVSVKKDSTFVVDEYKFGQKTSEQKSSFKLVKGGFRAITGAIGKNDKKNYKVRTPVATLGIRGTDFVVNLSKKGKLTVGVLSGGVSLQNNAGKIDLNPNEYGQVSGINQAPQSIPKPEGLFFSSDSVKKEKSKSKSDDKEKSNSSKKDGKDKEKKGKNSNANDKKSKDTSDEEGKAESEDSSEDSNAEGKPNDESSGDTGNDEENNSESETNAEASDSQTSDSEQSNNSDDPENGDNPPVEENNPETSAVSEDSITDNSDSPETGVTDITLDNDSSSTSDLDSGTDLGDSFGLGLDEGDIISSDAALEDFSLETNLFTTTVEPIDTFTTPVVTDDTLFSDVVKETTQEETFTEAVVPWTEVVITNDNQRRLVLSGTAINGLAIDSDAIPVVDATTSQLNSFYLQTDVAAESRLYVEQFSLDTAKQLDMGYDPTTNLTWGRWAEGSITSTLLNLDETQTIDLGTESLHWISGIDNSVITNLPIEGNASYTLIGNTNPTDSHGNIGVLGSARFDVNFTNQSASTQLNIGINNQSWSGSSNALSIGNGLFQGNLSVQVNDSTTGSSATGSGSVLGGFTGPANSSTLVPSGAAMSYQLNATPNGNDTTVSGVAAFGAKQ